MREDKCEGDSILDREHVRTILKRRPRTTDNANDTGAIHNRQTKMRYECVGISHWTNDPYGAYVDACVGGTNMDTLLDTGATTNLIRSDKARKIVDGPEIKLYRGHLETADGKRVAVVGCITTKLKLGVINDEIEALVVPELNDEMVIGLRSLRGYKCSLEFSRDNLWTGPTEGSVVPVFYKPPQLVPRVPPDPGGKNNLEANRWDRPILTNNMSSDVLDEIPEGWPVNYESHSVNMLHDNEAEDYDMYGCPKPVSLEEALRRTRGGGRSDMVAVFQETEVGDEDNSDAIRWERTKEEIATMQKEDEAIAQVFYWAGTADETSDMPSLGTNLIPKGQAIQYGPEALAYWSRWDELSIRGGILYKKWFQGDGSKPTLLTVVPARGRKEILGQFESMETSRGQLATEKILARIRQRFWWPTMRTDVERKDQWCLSQAAQNVCGKRKRAAVQAPLDPGIRFSTVTGCIGSNDDGDADENEARTCEDGHVHDVCDCGPSCVDRCSRRGSNNCGILGTEVWDSQCFAYGPRESLWQ